METKQNPTDIEALLRRVRPVVPSDDLRQRALARAREAWREAPATRWGWSVLRPWLAAAAVLALGVFLNHMLVSAGDSGPAETAVLLPSRTDSPDGLAGVLAEWRCVTLPKPSLTLDGWLRQRQTDLDGLFRERSPGSQPPPTAPPQAESRPGNAGTIVRASRPPRWTASWLPGSSGSLVLWNAVASPPLANATPLWRERVARAVRVSQSGIAGPQGRASAAALHKQPALARIRPSAEGSAGRGISSSRREALQYGWSA